MGAAPPHVLIPFFVQTAEYNVDANQLYVRDANQFRNVGHAFAIFTHRCMSGYARSRAPSPYRNSTWTDERSLVAVPDRVDCTPNKISSGDFLCVCMWPVPSESDSCCHGVECLFLTFPLVSILDHVRPDTQFYPRH